MKILRLSTLSLTLAIAVFALGYNSSFADNPDRGECAPEHCNHGGDAGFPAGITVQLSGGAFESVNPTIVGVTAESKFELSGDDPIHMDRPGITDPDLQYWIEVFNLCGLLGNPGTSDVPEFTVPAGRKPWTVEKGVNEVWVNLGFPVDSPLAPSNPLFTSEPLSVALNLKGACLDLECSLIPGSTLTIHLTDYSIHLRAKGGVTHQAPCHAKSGEIGVTTDLVITAL